MTSTLDEKQSREFLNRSMLLGTGIALAPAAVGAYIVAKLLGLAVVDASVWAVLAGDIAVCGVLLPRFVQAALTRRAFEVRSDDVPGARLQRLLELPRRIEVQSSTLAWVVGSAAFPFMVLLVSPTNAVSITPAKVVFALLVGTALSAMNGIPTTLLNQRLLQDAVVEEFHRHPKLAPHGFGALWPRKSWYLPYVFVVLVFCLMVFLGVVLTVQYRASIEEMVKATNASGDPALALQLRSAADQLFSEIWPPVVVIAAVLLAVFVGSALLLGRRESEAAQAIQRSLTSIAAGAPLLPGWIDTDESGDVAAATAAVASEMRELFNNLGAVATGDLSVEIHGDSGLAKAFNASQRAMQQLAESMRVISRGELVDKGEVPGELGRSFELLATAMTSVVAQARTIAAGDLRQDVAIAGHLGRALDGMTTSLRRMVGELQRSAGKTGEIVVALRSTATQLSAAATEQVSALTETANTMTEMSQTSAVSADRAGDLIKQGVAASTVVEDGRRNSMSAVTAMTAISEALRKVAQASGALAERVQRIDTITEAVGFLADQSSTLAINAGIEASRAGESGRGFAAVAREMRSLASDSRKATIQIRELVGELRQKTVQVDDLVADGTSTVDDGVSQVSRLGEVVEQLGITIHEAVGLMRQVEGSARQHQVGVGQVSQALISMQSASQSIRDGAKLLSELSEQAQTMANGLKGTVQSFELPGPGRAAAPEAA